MLKRTILRAAVTAAVVGGVLLVKALKKEPAEDTEEEDDEIHFITIEDPEETKEEPVGYDASGKSEAVQEICAVYPYLNPDFVEGILGANNGFVEEFEDDTLVTVIHESSFKSAEAAAQFVEIMDTAGYTCTEKGNHVIGACKKLFTQDGAIVSDILNVANQTCALKGTYTDYDVEAE